jgi:senataxin
VIAKRARSLQEDIVGRLLSLPQEYKDSLEALCQGLEDAAGCELIRSQSAERLLVLAQNVYYRTFGGLQEEAVQYDIMKSANVIFCTLCSSGKKVLKDQELTIEDLIVDEAAAATEPELYIPLSRFRPSRLLVVGDPLQLPATVESPLAKRLGLDRSLHARLMYDCGWNYQMLTVQYRMHPAISLFPSRRFYLGKLTNGETFVQQARQDRALLLFQRQPYIFWQVHGEEEKVGGGDNTATSSGRSSINRLEARKVVELIQQMKQRAHQTSDENWCIHDRVRIITFYKAQVIWIRKLLKRAGLDQVLVSTVDSSQGAESD